MADQARPVFSHDQSVQSVAFNQDFGCFACGLANGFAIFNSEPLKRTEKQEIGGGIHIVEMLFRCNCLALVGGGDDPVFPANYVLIWDDTSKRIIAQIDVNTPVLAVRLRRDRIVVVLQSMIKVYTLTQTPRLLHTFETGDNPNGVCCLSASSQRGLLVYPSKQCSGSVTMLDLTSVEPSSCQIDAHESQVACLALNTLGTMLATASKKGTIVRVFHTKTTDKLFEFRRGTSPASIFCISFSHDSSLLSVVSNHGTIHVYSVVMPDFNDQQLRRVENRQRFLPGLFTSAGHSGAAPSLIKIHMPQADRFKKLRNRKQSVEQFPRSVCAFGADNKSILVVSVDGTYCKYNFDLKTRECSRLNYANFITE